MSHGMRWTQEDLDAHLQKITNARTSKIRPEGKTWFMPTVRPQKYRAQRTQVGETWFDSKREAARYQQLHIMLKAGAIADLELQPRFELIASNGEICGHYRADFRYRDVLSGAIVIEDVKSEATKTTAYRLRKRWVQACHGITIREV